MFRLTLPYVHHDELFVLERNQSNKTLLLNGEELQVEFTSFDYDGDPYVATCIEEVYMLQSLPERRRITRIGCETYPSGMSESSKPVIIVSSNHAGWFVCVGWLHIPTATLELRYQIDFSEHVPDFSDITYSTAATRLYSAQQPFTMDPLTPAQKLVQCFSEGTLVAFVTSSLVLILIPQEDGTLIRSGTFCAESKYHIDLNRRILPRHVPCALDGYHHGGDVLYFHSKNHGWCASFRCPRV